MQWTDEGLVVGVRPHGESSIILELLTEQHGRHLGIVRGGRSRRLRPALQLGNRLAATWRARLDDHLGNFTVELLSARAGTLMEGAAGLYGITYLSALARLLPERDPHPVTADAADIVAQHIGDPLLGPIMLARFELHLLAELGFGLDLSECAATGTREDLVYVSPKSGRAVSRAAGAPWADRMLALPAFLLDDDAAEPDAGDLRAAYRLAGFFLDRDVFEPRGLHIPEARAAYLALLR
jgi:DNA repair protein RecO (recombination protein O)